MGQPIRAMIMNQLKSFILAVAIVVLALNGSAFAQDGKQRGVPKPVTVPISFRFRDSTAAETREVVLLLREDGDIQQEVSRRTPLDSPMSLAILFQDDLVSSAAIDAKNMAGFIRDQPGGSRVMVAYIRPGSLEVRKKLQTRSD